MVVVYLVVIDAPENLPQAFSLIEDVANQLGVQSQFILGLLYYMGHGTTKNINVAKKWFSKGYGNGYYQSYTNDDELKKALTNIDSIVGRKYDN